MTLTGTPSGEHERVARIEAMLETYMAEHRKLHEDTAAQAIRAEQRSYELAERLDRGQRDLTRSLMSIEATLRSWRVGLVALVALVSALLGAFGGPLLVEFLSRR